MDVFIQLLINGILLGSMYAIISVGLTMIFGIVRVRELRHGEFLMVGMYAAYLLAAKFGLHPYAAAVPIVLLLFAMGAIVQRFIIQPLLSADEHIQIFATVGLSTALVNLALLLFGADLYAVPASSVQRTVMVGGFSLVIGQIVMFVCALALVAGPAFVHAVTPLGRAIRATAQNRTAALLMGVRVDRIYVISFGIGAACVGLAARALVMPLYPVSPTIGTYFVLTAFVVVVLGGMRSMYGAFFGRHAHRIVDSLSGYYIAPDLKEVVYFAIFIAILIFKPTGLFGSAVARSKSMTAKANPVPAGAARRPGLLARLTHPRLYCTLIALALLLIIPIASEIALPGPCVRDHLRVRGARHRLEHRRRLCGPALARPTVFYGIGGYATALLIAHFGLTPGSAC